MSSITIPPGQPIGPRDDSGVSITACIYRWSKTNHVTTWTTSWMRQHIKHAPSPYPAADNGQPQVLGAEVTLMVSALIRRLCQRADEVDRGSGFFDIIHQDPVPSQIKAIAEPWDPGNREDTRSATSDAMVTDRQDRDRARDYWRGSDRTIGEFASRLTGSSDLYEANGRRPYASVNFITAHDGFTLTDLVSYDDRHNEANGEENRDGNSDNRSWNCGAEGPTSDDGIVTLRSLMRRNFLATLFLSLGVPMLSAGDEIGRSQRGNNNAYCQDNELSWLDWQNADEDLLEFARQIIKFRKEHPVFRRRKWYQGRSIRGSVDDIAWFRPDAKVMSDEDWGNGFAKSLAVFLNGEVIPTPDQFGRRIIDSSFYLIFNPHWEPVNLVLPTEKWGKNWRFEFSTALTQSKNGNTLNHPAGSELMAEPRSLIVLNRIAELSRKGP